MREDCWLDKRERLSTEKKQHVQRPGGRKEQRLAGRFVSLELEMCKEVGRGGSRRRC